MTVDTLDYVRKLEAAGVDRRQAEAHAQALRDAVETNLVTKTDLGQATTEVQSEVRSLRDELKGDIRELRDELKGDIRALKIELKGDVDSLRRELRGETATLRAEMAAVRGEIDTTFHSFEALLWKHTAGVLLGVLAIGGLLIRFLR
jgi:chromosome segregation ATPase